MYYVKSNLFKACKKRLATVTASNINVNNSAIAEQIKSILACFQLKKEIVLSDDLKTKILFAILRILYVTKEKIKEEVSSKK